MTVPIGVPGKDAIHSIGGIVYQTYQAAIAWTEIKQDDLLFLEVAEDFAVVAKNGFEAVQVKNKPRDTISLTGVLPSIDDFITLLSQNPQKRVSFRYLTTATITTEKRTKDRVGKKPMLETWRSLAITGDLHDFRKILQSSKKLSTESRTVLSAMTDGEFREKILRRVHFDCGAMKMESLKHQLDNKVLQLLKEREGDASHVDSCIANICHELMERSIKHTSHERVVTQLGLEKHLIHATQVSINQIQLKSLIESIQKWPSPTSSTVVNRIDKPRRLIELNLPLVMADRRDETEGILNTLTEFGICWVFGIAGIGKSTIARAVARKTAANWSTINLRGLDSDQVSSLMENAADSLTEFDGLLIEDCNPTNTHTIESFLYLLQSAFRLDIMVLCSSANAPDSDLLFRLDRPGSISRKLTEFSLEDIKDILKKEEIPDPRWAEYIYLISGGGHPQLAMAEIQSLGGKNWIIDELSTSNLLFQGEALEQVREKTRKRLQQELPKNSRELLARLSLKISGTFNRDFALDIANAHPKISDGGIILDDLSGTWIDQLEQDMYHLSPLVSNFAAKTLGSEETIGLQNVIAKSLTKHEKLNVTDLNDILWAACCTKNSSIIINLSLLVLNSDELTLKNILPHFNKLAHFQIDSIACSFDPTASHLLRGAQLILLKEKANLRSLKPVLEIFEKESANDILPERDITNVIVYTKLLITQSETVDSEFTTVIGNLNKVRENATGKVYDFLEILNPSIGILFFGQITRLTQIRELDNVFEYLNTVTPEFRSALLAPLLEKEVNVGSLALLAWWKEVKNGTINPEHRTSFNRQLYLAESWGEHDLARACRICQAHIADEYSNDTNFALKVLDDGLHLYPDDSTLLTAKSKVLFGVNELRGFQIASSLMHENDLTNFDRATLGRDSGIAAEKLGKFPMAREYFLYGSLAAEKSNIPDIRRAMSVGLLADAALAAWHQGDRITCLEDFVKVLKYLDIFSAEDSLRSAHCHKLSFHVLLWLCQDAKRENYYTLPGGQDLIIYPGCVSNPNPSEGIDELEKPPTDLAWYLLAAVENYASLDIGITRNLENHLNNGPLLEGEDELTSAKMHNAFISLNVELFHAAISETVSQDHYYAHKSINPYIFNYGTHSLPPLESQKTLVDVTESTVLLFCAMCIFQGKDEQIAMLVARLTSQTNLFFRPNLLKELSGIHVEHADISSRNARFLFLVSTSQRLSVKQIFKLSYFAMKWSNLKYEQVCIPSILYWLEQILKDQNVHKQNHGSPRERLILLLIAIAPEFNLAVQLNQMR